jgi:hypothetical protein
MAYDEFTLDILLRKFPLRLEEHPDLFAEFAPVPLSDLLQRQLDEYLALALEISTEKARSEFIIAPILGEIRRHFQKTISLFSGVEFNVDMERGLHGVCDYMLSLSPLQLVIQAPVVAVVEAKNENIKSGMGQCIAEMLAAQQFNQERQAPLPVVYGGCHHRQQLALPLVTREACPGRQHGISDPRCPADRRNTYRHDPDRDGSRRHPRE